MLGVKPNQVAHYLPKYVFHNSDCIWIEETPPPYIYAVLVFDLFPDFY